MLATSRTVDRAKFEAETGWLFKPEGACKGDVCIPLSEAPGETIDVVAVAEQMGLPVATEDARGLIAVGPESIGSRALTTARAPELTLPDLDGKLFSLSSLRGQKVLLYAWAPY